MPVMYLRMQPIAKNQSSHPPCTVVFYFSRTDTSPPNGEKWLWRWRMPLRHEAHPPVFSFFLFYAR